MSTTRDGISNTYYLCQQGIKEARESIKELKKVEKQTGEISKIDEIEVDKMIIGIYKRILKELLN